MSELAGVPDDEIDLMTYKNAMRLFRYDPFQHIAKDQATVGAFRALAVDVDLTLKSQDGLHAREDKGIVTAAQVATQLASAMTAVE